MYIGLFVRLDSETIKASIMKFGRTDMHPRITVYSQFQTKLFSASLHASFECVAEKRIFGEKFRISGRVA